MAEDGSPNDATERDKPRREHDGRWSKGSSGNIAGNAKGSRHKATLAVEALLEGQAEGLTQKALELALAGDMTALRVCLDRIVPARRDRTVAFELPRMQTTSDAIVAISALADAVAAGEISPSEGAELGKLIDSFTRALEAHDLAGRIARLGELANEPA